MLQTQPFPCSPSNTPLVPSLRVFPDVHFAANCEEKYLQGQNKWLQVKEPCINAGWDSMLHGYRVEDFSRGAVE